MSILTYLTQAQIRSSATELNGKTLTRPLLKITDGLNVIYGVDVDLGLGAPVKNVPIARSNRELLYAEAGAAVRLRRSASGQWEVVGYSQELPGSHTSVPVDLGTFTLGSPVSLTLEGRTLTYEELSTLGTYGLTPYGSVGIFIGGVLTEIKV